MEGGGRGAELGEEVWSGGRRGGGGLVGAYLWNGCGLGDVEGVKGGMGGQ